MRTGRPQVRQLALVADGGKRVPAAPINFDKGITCAVLPFTADDRFGDMLADDLIGELARFQNVSVAARGASFALRDHAGDTQRVASELGVQFVLEGALRRLGADRMRIDVRLLDGESGQVIASERFEHSADDLALNLDEVVRQITARMAPELDMAGMRRAERLPVGELRVQEMALRARALLWRGSEAEDAAAIDTGLALAREALERDPRYADGWRVLAFGHCLRGERGAFGPSSAADYEAADAAAARLRG
ncbi:MAG: hypothetical protein JOZ05_19350, partial [Acetobacteraceae bacterium]|nr:hypothetical protein [Acetobacteraceae bacterium]